MQTIKLSEIQQPPSRQRSASDPTKLADLIRSIQEEGLFHAIILDQDGYLVAGHNRIQAVRAIADKGFSIQYDNQNISLGEIPYTKTHKIDEFSLFKIELEENLRREQLSPLDEASALARLHEMMKAGAPELAPGLKQEVTFKDTAKEVMALKGEAAGHINTEAQKISDSILVKAYEKEPGVKKAKTFGEAVKEARKAAQREWQTIYGHMTRGDNLDSKHKVICAPCQEALLSVPAGSVDVIIADPPYGIGADTFGEQSLGHEYLDDCAAFEAVYKAIQKEAPRICKPDAALFMFVDLLTWYQVVVEAVIAEPWLPANW